MHLFLHKAVSVGGETYLTSKNVCINRARYFISVQRASPYSVTPKMLLRSSMSGATNRPHPRRRRRVTGDWDAFMVPTDEESDSEEYHHEDEDEFHPPDALEAAVIIARNLLPAETTVTSGSTPPRQEMRRRTRNDTRRANSPPRAPPAPSRPIRYATRRIHSGTTLRLSDSASFSYENNNDPPRNIMRLRARVFAPGFFQAAHNDGVSADVSDDRLHNDLMSYAETYNEEDEARKHPGDFALLAMRHIANGNGFNEAIRLAKASLDNFAYGAQPGETEDERRVRFASTFLGYGRSHISHAEMPSEAEEAARMQRLTAERAPVSITQQHMPSLLCPITQEVFCDPVYATDGHVYERSAILQWLEQKQTSPMTQRPIGTRLRDAVTVRKAVEEWTQVAKIFS